MRSLANPFKPDSHCMPCLKKCVDLKIINYTHNQFLIYELVHYLNFIWKLRQTSDSNSRMQLSVSPIIQLEVDFEVPIKLGPVILSSINQAVLRGQTPTHGGFHFQSNNLVMSFVRYLYN